MESSKTRKDHFYTTRPVPRVDKRKMKHLSLDVQSMVSAAESTSNAPRETLSLQFLSKAQQAVRQRISSAKDPSIVDLSHCQLDQIPKFIFYDANFQVHLRELNLSFNKLPSIPPMIGMLTNLVTLDCNFNKISDLPVELADLPELQNLHLAGNPLTPTLKQYHLMGTAALIQHLHEKRNNAQTSADPPLRKRDRISKLFNGESSTSKEVKPPKSPKEMKPMRLSQSQSQISISEKEREKERDESGEAEKKEGGERKESGDKKEGDRKEKDEKRDKEKDEKMERDDKNRLIIQMKIGLEDSINLNAYESDTKLKSNLTDESKSQFKFNTYCNSSFTSLRTMGGVDAEQYKKSIASFTALGFSGKSGSVLLRSGDNLLVLKTISMDESAFLRRMLYQYCDYIRKNPNSVLTRFWGLYKVVRSPIDKVCFVVMKNAFSGAVKIHERYDLKGSTVGRFAGEENIRLSRVVLKDLDLCLMKRRIRLGPSHKTLFLDQISSDCRFLEKFEIIDYSLIYGIHYLDDGGDGDDSDNAAGGGTGGGGGAKQESASPRPAHARLGEIIARGDDDNPVGELYFMSIIDFLQPYNLRKQMEYGLKSIRYGDGMSVIPPSQYASRFISFISAIVD